jgi:TIM-barrel protein
MFRPRVAVASLSGEADTEWAREAAANAGCAFLGGIAIDEPTRTAARAMTDRDRSEFLPDDPIAFIDRQLRTLGDVPIRPGFNVRSTSLEPIERAGAVCREHDAILELNAHCRQTEMCSAGAGESLLGNPARLITQVEAADSSGVTVSVKVRAEVDGVDLPELSQRLAAAGADVLHVDAMDSEPIIRGIANVTDCFLIANNGVRDRDTVREYLEYGADAVSVGRASDDPEVMRAVRRAVEAWHVQEVADD